VREGLEELIVGVGVEDEGELRWLKGGFGGEVIGLMSVSVGLNMGQMLKLKLKPEGRLVELGSRKVVVCFVNTAASPMRYRCYVI
jgi:hypothetical protein